jgi:hypothetical protein
VALRSPPPCAPQKQQRAYYYLWQLYHLSQDTDAAQTQLAEAQAKLEALTASNANFGAELEAAK